jgi:hypothetical protein
MEGKLTPLSISFVKTLLTDSKISAKVFENLDEREKYKICTIEGNGNVVLGKSPFKWLNRLLNCQDVLPFESFALKVWDALVDASAGLNKQAVLRGLSQEIVLQSVRNREYDYVVNRLFDCWRHIAQGSEGYQDPKNSAEFMENNQVGDRVMIAKTALPKIVINLVNGAEKTIPIIDSVGDTLTVALDFGIRGLRLI